MTDSLLEVLKFKDDFKGKAGSGENIFEIEKTLNGCNGYSVECFLERINKVNILLRASTAYFLVL